MIDFINKRNNRKIDFIILPSLLSNSNYLENGKFWVFTYKNDAFKLCELRFENLVNNQEKYKANYSNNNKSNSQTNNRDINSLRKQINNLAIEIQISILDNEKLNIISTKYLKIKIR